MDGASCWGLSGRVVDGSAGDSQGDGLHPCGQVQGQGDDGAPDLVGGEAVQGECGQGGQYAAGAEYALIVYDDAGGTEEAAT